MLVGTADGSMLAPPRDDSLGVSDDLPSPTEEGIGFGQRHAHSEAIVIDSSEDEEEEARFNALSPTSPLSVLPPSWQQYQIDEDRIEAFATLFLKVRLPHHDQVRH